MAMQQERSVSQVSTHRPDQSIQVECTQTNVQRACPDSGWSFSALLAAQQDHNHNTSERDKHIFKPSVCVCVCVCASELAAAGCSLGSMVKNCSKGLIQDSCRDKAHKSIFSWRSVSCSKFEQRYRLSLIMTVRVFSAVSAPD